MNLDELLRATLAEDLGDAGDLTSMATVPADAVLDVAYVTRERGVVAGLPVLARLAEIASPSATFTAYVEDGETVEPGVALAGLRGPARDVLAMERTSLNILGHLSGIATATRAWSDALDGTGARVRDTRKTMPLLRDLEKYAVRCGGGVNHRAGLYDAILVKDNHVAAAGGTRAALEAIRSSGIPDDVVVQVEVDDFTQLQEALDAGAPQILLDNFDLAALEKAVAVVRDIAPGTVLEASGGLTLDSACAVGATGVDYLAVGALTHSTRSLDIGLDACE